MAREIVAIKLHDHLKPATAADAEAMSAYKNGSALKLKVVSQSARSLANHRLYWGGLLGLAIDYWEPTGGLVQESEIRAARNFARWLDSKSQKSGAISGACDVFLSELEQSRALKVESPEKSIDGLHRWVKENAGYYDLVMTPSGIVKEVKSINFNAMDQAEFSKFYKAAFGVVWRMILSRSFESEAECQNVIDQLVSMG